jgi:flagellar hook protein FlgE
MMDVVGHNIANVNTPGFKASIITFQEALAQQVRGAAGSDPDQGGINRMDIGLGTRVASIDPIFSQGATQITGRATDLAIQGDGFFMLGLGSDRFYTRAGSFTFDEVGNLTAPDGLHVLGWTADANGDIDTQGAIGKIQLPVAQLIDPQVTTIVEMGGNLSSDLTLGEVHNTSIVVHDSIGTGHELSVQFTKTAPNAWDVTAAIDGTAVTTTPGAITFASDGTLSGATSIGISGFAPPGADPMAFTVALAGTTPVVQFGGSSTAEASPRTARPSASCGRLRSPTTAPSPASSRTAKPK